MDNELKIALYNACLQAAEEMGDEIYNMSCFVSNWSDLYVVQEDE